MAEKKAFDHVEDSTSEVMKSLRVPPWCPFCGLPMKGKSTQKFYDFGCCIVCFIHFVEHREQRWRDGWRPTRADVDAMHASLEKREEEE